MRILMTTDTVGGVWTFTSELTEQLLQRGHAVHLVSFGRKPSAEQAATQESLRARYADLFGFTNSAIALEWMQENASVQAEGAALLIDVVQSAAKPDLIVSNQFCYGHLNTSIPRVVVAHSDVLSWARACKPSALEPNPWLNRYTSMVQTGLLDAAAVITPTAWMGKALTTSFFMPRNFFVIPNGVSVEAPPATTGERKLQAITAGRLWDEAKGFDTLRDLQSPMPLLIAGDNTLRPEYPTEAWPEHLTNLGPLRRADLHQHFRQSAIYLCTSHYEPFGLAPLEAALCGCAIVARDLPSLREVWADNVVYFTDGASLSLTLNKLANDPILLNAVQERSQQRAQHFTPERMADSYLHLFQTILGQRQGTQHVA